MMKADYEQGEQFWKLWLTNVVCGVQIRVATKRKSDGTFAAEIIFVDTNRKVKRHWGTETITDEKKLDAEIEDFIRSTEDERLKFRCLDLTACKRFDQFVHMISESEHWTVDDLVADEDEGEGGGADGG
jgi:hypothetical protein